MCFYSNTAAQTAFVSMIMYRETDKSEPRLQRVGRNASIQQANKKKHDSVDDRYRPKKRNGMTPTLGTSPILYHGETEAT